MGVESSVYTCSTYCEVVSECGCRALELDEFCVVLSLLMDMSLGHLPKQILICKHLYHTCNNAAEHNNASYIIWDDLATH